MIKYFILLWNQKKVKQIVSLYFSLLISLFLGIATSILNTRLLGPQQFGDMKYIINIFSFISSFFGLGVFVSGSKLLAQKENENIRQDLIGALLVLAMIFSIILIMVVFIISFFQDKMFNNQLGIVIRLFSPFLFIYPFQFCLNNIMQGDNRIYALSLFTIFPQTSYLIIALLYNTVFHLSIWSSLFIQFLGLTVIMIFLIVKFKPRIGDIRKNILIIRRDAKEYGFHVYIGSLAGVATSQLAGILIGYFINNINVGYYSLATTLASPLALIPSVAGTTFFKDFANQKSINKKASLITIILSICALISFLFLIDKLMSILYTKDFRPAIPLTYIVAFASVANGLGDFINRFLGAHGKGKELRNAAFLVGIVNVFGFIILVKYFGVVGAAYTRVIAYFLYLILMYSFYKKYQHSYDN